MKRHQFVQFIQATFNAMDMISPVEGATAVVQAYNEIETETIQSCLKQVSDKWAARCARAELRVALLNSRIRRMQAARKRERAKRSRQA